MKLNAYLCQLKAKLYPWTLYKGSFLWFEYAFLQISDTMEIVTENLIYGQVMPTRSEQDTYSIY